MPLSYLLQAFFTLGGKNLQFESIVLVRLVFSANSVSANGTPVYQLSVYKGYPIPYKGTTNSVHIS